MRTLRNSTIALLMVFGALIAAGAGRAHATPLQDSQYVSCVSAEGLINDFGPAAMAALGRALAIDIAAGVRSPVAEAELAAWQNPRLTQSDANVLVNCATEVWLGYGPEGPHANQVV